MPIDFPNSPTNGDLYSAGGKNWQYNGSAWVLLGVSVTVTPADGSITAVKIASNAVTEAKVNDGAITQNKMASGLSGITVTTTALRSTVVPSPFTGQFVFLTDTSALQRWDGSAWVAAITTAPTGAPTGLALVSATGTTATISFSAGADGGSTITNYQYALSTNGGSTFGSYTALSPADGTSPITITGLSAGISYQVKLKAVNALGAGSSESSALSFSTQGLSIEYLVVAGGGGATGYNSAGGGGAGGFRTNVAGATSGRNSSAEAALTVASATNFAVTVGAGGTGNGPPNGGETGMSGSNSVFSTITSLGGGHGGNNFGTFPRGGNGGSGGGSRADTAPNSLGGLGTAGQGFDGGSGLYSGNFPGGGGGGAGANGGAATVNTTAGNGGAGLSNPITGSTIGQLSGGIYYLAGGGGGSAQGGGAGTSGSGGLGGGGAAGNAASSSAGTSGTPNTGGGGGAGNTATGGNGGSGVVIVRYLTSEAGGYTITGGTKEVGPAGAADYTVHSFTSTGTFSLVFA